MSQNRLILSQTDACYLSEAVYPEEWGLTCGGKASKKPEFDLPFLIAVEIAKRAVDRASASFLSRRFGGETGPLLCTGWMPSLGGGV
jgi:hypothetical protein